MDNKSGLGHCVNAVQAGGVRILHMAITRIHFTLVVALTGILLGCNAQVINRLPSAPDSQKCLAASGWFRLDDGMLVAVSGIEAVSRAAKQDVVLLGESHTSKDDHRWQLQTLAALHLLHPDMVIGFESFPRRLQPVLDKWVAGRLTVEQFLQQTEWDKVWGYPSELYLPLFHFARINRILMVAINVDLSLPRAVRKQGWNAVPMSEKVGISRPATPPDAYVDRLYDVFKEHAFAHGNSGIGKAEPRFRHFVQAQTTWDRAMAEALAAQLKSDETGGRPLVVGIMGAGHIRHGYGVPYQLHDLGIDRVAVLLPVDADRGCQPFDPAYADAVFVLPKQPASEAKNKP